MYILPVVLNVLSFYLSFFYKIYKCVHTAECVRVVKMILILLNFK